MVNIDKLVNSFLSIFDVTPFMGVWIEIGTHESLKISLAVTPFMGVWIEILLCIQLFAVEGVTPFMGVWIEILTYYHLIT